MSLEHWLAKDSESYEVNHDLPSRQAEYFHRSRLIHLYGTVVLDTVVLLLG